MPLRRRSTIRVSRLVFLFPLLVVLNAISGISCDSNTGPANHPPVIVDIIVDPPTVTVADTVSLAAVASDADGDSLEFMWSASGGQLIEAAGDSAMWLAPELQGEYTITVQVSDGIDSAERSKVLSSEGVLVSGSIGGVWSKEYSPYIVAGDCVVEMYSMLVVQEGVEIRVRGPWEIVVRGSIRVYGAEQQPVLITSDNSAPRPGDWRRIRFVDDPYSQPPINPHFGNVLRWTIVEYAERAIVVDGAWTAPRIDRCLIRRNSDTGILTGGGSREGGFNTVITGCRISNNGVLGIRCDAGTPDGAIDLGSSDAVVTQCTVSDNGYSGGIDQPMSGGIYCRYFIGEIDSCAIVNNGVSGAGFGLRVEVVSFFPGIHGCILDGNSGFDLECRDVVDPWEPEDGEFDASGNYWGSDTTLEMNTGQNPKNITAIYDKHDDARLWEASYLGWLPEAPEIPRNWPAHW